MSALLLLQELDHSHKKRKDSLGTRAKLVVLRTYVENQAILEPILLYFVSKCKQTKCRGARTVYGPIFLPFYKIIVGFFSFFCQDVNKTGSNFAVIGCNLSKKHKLALYKTQSGEPNYVDHKVFFHVLPGATCTKFLGQTSKYYRAD